MHSERLWQLYLSINEWIRFADTKSGAAIAAHAAIAVAAIPPVTAQLSYIQGHSWLFVIVLSCTLLCGLSLFFGVRCIMPRLSVGEPKSIVFFGHIALAYDSPATFAAHAAPHYRDDAGFEQQVLDQIHANATIAWRKHKDSALCLRLFIGEFALAVAGFIISLFVL